MASHSAIPEPIPDPVQVKREERRIVEETEKAGGTVHEFDPHASPAQKAADAGKVVFNCRYVVRILADCVFSRACL